MNFLRQAGAPAAATGTRKRDRAHAAALENRESKIRKSGNPEILEVPLELGVHVTPQFHLVGVGHAVFGV